MESTELSTPHDGEVTTKKKSKKKVLGYSLAVLFLGLGGGALAFLFLLGGGPQPEDILPKDTVAIAKIDLDPKIGQRVNLVRFLSKFPNTLEDFDEDDPIGSILKQNDLTASIEWEAVKPWIGNRYAVAVLESANELKPVLVLAITNQEEMEYYFLKNHPELDYEVISDYVVIAESKSVVNLIVNAPSVLSENEKYQSDMKTLGGDQIASVWIDLRPISGLVADYFNDSFYEGAFEEAIGTTNAAQGRIALGMHFTPDAFVTDMITVDIGSNDEVSEYVSKSIEVLGGLPSSVMGAVSIEGVKDSISKSLLSSSEVRDLLDSLELRESEVTALFDGPVVVMALDRGIGTAPLFAIRFEPNNLDSVVLSMRQLLSRNLVDPRELDGVLFVDNNYLYLAEDSKLIREALMRAKSNGTNLGDSDLFKATITESGNLSAFVDLAKLLPRLDVNTNGAPLSGLGFIAGADEKIPGVIRASLVVSVK